MFANLPTFYALERRFRRPNRLEPVIQYDCERKPPTNSPPTQRGRRPFGGDLAKVSKWFAQESGGASFGTEFCAKCQK